MAGIGSRDLRGFDVLVVASLIWFLAKFVRYVFPTLFDTFRATYGVSNATLGLLFTALMLAYAAMQFPSGAIADRVGPTRVIVAGTLVTAGGAWLAFGIRSFLATAVAAVLIGLGTGAHKTVAITLLPRVYPQRAGGVLGTMDAIGHLGGAAGPAAVVLVLTLGLGGELVFLAVGFAGVALAVAFRHRLARRPAAVRRGRNRGEGQPAATGSDLRAYLAPFADPRLSAFVIVTVGYSFAWYGLTAFLPLYLVRETALAPAVAGLVYGSLFAVGLVQPATGALADRVGRHRVMVATLGLAGAGLLALLGTTAAVVAVAAVPLIGLGGHGFRPVRDAHLVDLIPPSVGGGTLGMARTLMLAAGAAAPAGVGYLSEARGFGVAFGLLAAALVIVTVIVGVLLVEQRSARPERPPSSAGPPE